MGGVVINGQRFFRSADVIDNFEGAFLTDRPLDADTADSIKAWARAASPTSAASAFDTIRALVHLTDAAHERQWPTGASELLTRGRIDDYANHVIAHYHPEAKRAVAFRLQEVARAVNSEHGYGPISPPARPATGPYDSECVAGFVSLVPLQATPYRSRILSAFLALCAGAGLRSTELLRITADHVHQVDGRVVVAVPGDSARTIPVEAAFEQMLLGLRAEVRSGLLVGRVNPTSALPLHNLKASIAIPEWMPPLLARRLRATWMLQQMMSLPAATFMHRAGIREFRVADWEPHLPHSAFISTGQSLAP